MNSESYKELLSTLAIASVSLGCSTVHVHRADELEEAQIGYSIDPSGTSLVDGEPGSWQSQWVVIGYEDSSGDPIFIDTETQDFPVYTAMHGTGNWEPSLIATGLRNFAAAMREAATVSKGRENPVQLEANPITLAERASVLERIQQHNPGIDPTFWEIWLG
jgi:hypothetical protein